MYLPCVVKPGVAFSETPSRRPSAAAHPLQLISQSVPTPRVSLADMAAAAPAKAPEWRAGRRIFRARAPPPLASPGPPPRAPSFETAI